jgi:hypothetical protein
VELTGSLTEQAGDVAGVSRQPGSTCRRLQETSCAGGRPVALTAPNSLAAAGSQNSLLLCPGLRLVASPPAFLNRQSDLSRAPGAETAPLACNVLPQPAGAATAHAAGSCISLRSALRAARRRLGAPSAPKMASGKAFWLMAALLSPMLALAAVPTDGERPACSAPESVGARVGRPRLSNL